MSMLSFMPWFDLDSEIKFPTFSLLPFRRNLLPFGKENDDQKQVDTILDFYQTLAGPVATGTILHLRNRSVFDDLDENEREEVFEIAHLVTFAGLSARKFFIQGSNSYCNSDLFACYIQAFSVPYPGAAIYSRRRDGQSISSGHRSVYKVLCPFHIPRRYNRGLDQALLQALVSAEASNSTPNLIEAISWFNLANTDSDTLHEPTELVAISGAFESALGLSHGKEDDLCDAWKTSFIPAQGAQVSSVQRKVPNGLKNCHSVREAWIRDLYRLRHGFAHGRRENKYKSVWSLKEHLLLASFGFPLLVKSLLSKHGHYTFDSESKLKLAAFEKLAAMPNLFSEESKEAWKAAVDPQNDSTPIVLKEMPSWSYQR